jgi:HD superfamily phosphodiesterase
MSPLVKKIRQEVINEATTSKYIDDWFLPEHLLVVEEMANWLCDQLPEADREVVILAVWFHDIGRLEGIEDGHDVYGAKKSRERLSETDISLEKIELVAEACLAHRAEEVKPASLEAKILATADAMSHFTSPLFYFRVIEHYRKTKTLEETLKIISNKLERDYEEKMVIEIGRVRVSEKYEAWKKILNI